MRRSHVCLACATELGRLRTVREPRYGLPILRCPTCRRVHVRRRHPLESMWRRVLRLDAALLGLFLQLAFGSVLIAAVAADAIELQRLLRKWLVFDVVPRRGEIAFATGFQLLLATALGAWMTAGLAHWRWWLRPIGVLAIALPLAWMDLLERPLGDRVDVLLGTLGRAEVPRSVDQLAAASRLVIVVLLLTLSPIGVPAGLAIRFVARRFRRARWRWRRRRLRATRFPAAAPGAIRPHGAEAPIGAPAP